MAQTDPLSKLYNRRYFLKHINIEFNRCARYSQPLSIIMIDIDFFININDTYGHLTGDKVISVISSLLKKNVRLSDLAARYGGEEFCIMLPQTEISEAVFVAEKLRKVIANTDFLSGKIKIKVTASFGIAGRKTSDKEIAQLLQRADNALYAAKKMGRNCVYIL